MHDKMTMYDSLACSFLRIKKPPKQPKCPVCGPNATIKSMEDYHVVSQAMRGPSCGVLVKPEVSPALQISCVDYKTVRDNGEPHILLDVRVKEQYDLCSLKGAVNLPLANLEQNLSLIGELSDPCSTCRRGANGHRSRIDCRPLRARERAGGSGRHEVPQRVEAHITQHAGASVSRA